MNRLLTTGEMIDRLQVGEVAIGDVNELGVEVEIFRDKEGHIKLKDTKHVLEMNAGMVDSVRWRILPKYVSFEEAMKALKSGKTVTLHDEETLERTLFRHWFILESREGLAFSDLFNDKWTIEEEV